MRAPNQPRANNGAIENYFQLKKRIVRESEFNELGHICKVKVGRYVPFLARHILSQVKAITYEIPSRSRIHGRKSRIDESQLSEKEVHQCIEQYKKKGLRPKGSSFFGSQRRSVSSNSSTQSQSSSTQNSRRSSSEPSSQPEEVPTTPRFPLHRSQKN